jgi:hypothetical protein
MCLAAAWSPKTDNDVQGGGGMGIFHMPSDFFFRQLVDPPSFLMRYVLVTCYVLFETALRKVRL